MDSITMVFGGNVNVSLTVGDIVFFKSEATDKVYQMGAATALGITSLICEINPGTPRPAIGDFIFFVKSAEVNLSGLTGYYASVTMEVTGSAKKELFAVSAEMFPSS
jgi:hypothetical protein